MVRRVTISIWKLIVTAFPVGRRDFAVAAVLLMAAGFLGAAILSNSINTLLSVGLMRIFSDNSQVPKVRLGHRRWKSI